MDPFGLHDECARLEQVRRNAASASHDVHRVGLITGFSSTEFGDVHICSPFRLIDSLIGLINGLIGL